MPDEAEAHGLLALLLLTEARRPARTSDDGSLVRLADQDRSRWDHALVAEGQAIVRACLRWNRPGTYQIQAAIAAVHSDAETAADTDWGQIVALYDQLLALLPTPVVALNRAIAVAELRGPGAGLELVDSIDLDGYHLFHATRGDLLARLGRDAEAVAAYDEALARTANGAERDLLERNAPRSRCLILTDETGHTSGASTVEKLRLEHLALASRAGSSAQLTSSSGSVSRS